ncbi:MAG: hypothetical protein ACK4FB_00185 [Brevundimonas sp.]|uniref:hypothetical protein n=1 Tax=Brevundimonas sp. TaxID=1871086 RepID=UPI00391A3703
MSQETTGASLPASINDGAAWAAFDHVQKLPWTLRFETFDPLTLDVDHDVGFQLCLDGAGTSDFQKQARGYMAMRVLEIAASLDENRLRVLGHSTEEVRSCATTRAKTLQVIRDAVVGRLRSELTKLFDARPTVWAERLRTLIATLPSEQGNQVARYSGLDQERDPKEIRAGLNYVFQTLEPQIVRDKERLILVGQERKMREARAARNDPNLKARARNLVLRALEASLASCPTGDVNNLLSTLEANLRERVVKDGSWGLIDAVIQRDRVMEGLTLPTALPSEIWDLVRQQERRIGVEEA